MPHSPNLRYRDNVAIHLNSKGAKKFDEAREKTISSKRGTSDGVLVKRKGMSSETMKALESKNKGAFMKSYLK